MINILIIIFTMTLTYLAVAGRLDTYIRVLALQGLLLAGVAVMELWGSEHVSIANTAFILLETLVVKAIVVPVMLTMIVRRNKLKHEIAPYVSNFFSLFTVMTFIIFSFLVAHRLHNEHLKITYFTASVSALFTGIFLIVSRKKIITHVMGYMVLENGIFLLSLALGSEMPMIVNMGILLDLLTSVLILSIFVNRIGDVFKTVEISNLTDLKD
jgi:hydrogenase-4 component E